MILSLFFTRGVSLELWLSTGLFDREKLIYEEHLKNKTVKKVYWLTYGSNDKELAKKLKLEDRLHRDIEILEMPKIFQIKKIGSIFYSVFMPFFHKKSLSRSDIFKTNQMDGSWSAVLSKILYRKYLVVRTGYMLSQLEFNKNLNSLRYKIYLNIERLAYKYCDRAIVASEHNKEYIRQKNFLSLEKIHIIKNFIDTNRFKNLHTKRYKDRILFVGRLNQEKNLFNLLKSIKHTGVTLDIYGQGELDNELKVFAKENSINVNFMGVAPNMKLPEIYNKYKFYILPSYFEGMPKSLLEAMSCGCICIGTDVNGINEVIKNNFNGYLSPNTLSNSIANTISFARAQNENLELINNAERTILKEFSLESVSILEREVFMRLNYE